MPQVGVRFFAPCAFIDAVELMPTDGSVQLDGKRKVRNEPLELQAMGELPPTIPPRSGRVQLNAHGQSWGYLMALAFRPIMYTTGPRRYLSEEEVILYTYRQKTQVEHDKREGGDLPANVVGQACLVSDADLGCAFDVAAAEQAVASQISHLDPSLSTRGVQDSPRKAPCDSMVAVEAVSSNDFHTEEPQTSDDESASGVSKSSDGANTCVICLSMEVNSLIRPCGHTAMCMRCADDVCNHPPPRCPICRMTIDSVLYASSDAIARSKAAAPSCCPATSLPQSHEAHDITVARPE